MKATKLKTGLLKGNASLYRLDPPLEDHTHVVSSTIIAFDHGGVETLVFPADETGKVTSWLEIAGGRDMSDNDEPLTELGYEVEGG